MQGQLCIPRRLALNVDLTLILFLEEECERVWLTFLPVILVQLLYQRQRFLVLMISEVYLHLRKLNRLVDLANVVPLKVPIIIFFTSCCGPLLITRGLCCQLLPPAHEFRPLRASFRENGNLQVRLPVWARFVFDCGGSIIAAILIILTERSSTKRQ